MPDRVQVADLYKNKGYLPTIQPTARPVDTFITPSKPQQDIRLLELAQAWSEVQPGLTRFAQERIEHTNQLDVEKGREAALANKAQFKEAVQKGALPAGASPWFRVGYERQKAARTALEYDQALKEAYAQTDLVNSDDPAAVTKWSAEFTKGWLESHPDTKDNPEFGRTFAVMGSASQDKLQTMHAVARTQKIEKDAAADTDFMLSAALDSGTDLLGVRNPNLGQELATIVGEQVANGLSGPMANKLVADAVIRKAIEEEDVTTLDLLMEVPSGSGTVGQIGYVKDAVAQARDRIAAQVNHRDRISHLKREDDKKNVINAVRGDAYRMIAENPYADTRQQFQMLNPLDPDEAAKIESFRTAYLGSLNAQNKVLESGPLKTQMLIDAMHGDLTEQQVEDAVANREIDAETAKDLLVNHIPKAKEQKSVLTSPGITQLERDIKSVITKNELADDFADQRAYRASQATAEFLQGMMEYREINPKATKQEILKHGRELQKTVLDIFREEGAEALPEVNLDNSDPTKTPLFKDAAALDLEIETFNKSQGTTGKLSALAQKYQMDPVSFINAQKKLLKQSPKK